MALVPLALCLLMKSTIAIQGPCDIFASGSTPCVAAHSTVRALFGAFNGPLYQVKRASDNATRDISVVSAGGYADAASQDTFCQNTNCVIQRIYDQSSEKNHLDTAPAGGYVHHPDKPVSATRQPLTVDNGNKVYAAYFEGAMGYRIDKTSGVATGNDPETIYMVTSGKHYNGGCCFDYGNAETNNNDDGKSTMEALYFGNATGWGRGADNGPWVMADLENGLWAGNETVNNGNTPITSTFVFAMVKGGSNGFALKGGDANGASLKSLYDGPRPPGYQPMHKQGSIILGIGGDNSDSAIGTFFEGAM
eukprot:CAMPEP_0201575660 /NCGR_PEP_ID=MMETSP0190_2-20130828/20997_1 /ASSEMBLY_ACC=CAM_ASM_000263 /TAXON_ID=37353 /ORGANISM="Rosalina sp." /LENGTH=306 /DNA_ID=CAMNT_0048005557 /DNA_START=48 /DNA_END=965 /DNA_ORIENTATION=+